MADQQKKTPHEIAVSLMYPDVTDEYAMVDRIEQAIRAEREDVISAKVDAFKSFSKLARLETKLDQLREENAKLTEANKWLMSCRDIMERLQTENSRMRAVVEWVRNSVQYDSHLDKLREENARIREALITCKNHCLCGRFKTPGFDYGETHKKLGKPKTGARWLTPSDIAVVATELTQTPETDKYVRLRGAEREVLTKVSEWVNCEHDLGAECAHWVLFGHAFETLEQLQKESEGK